MISVNDRAIKHVRTHLTDEKSLAIFDHRLMHALTGDYSYIRNMLAAVLSDTQVYKNLRQIETSPKRKAIFGTGAFGNLTYERFADVNWFCYIDNFPKNRVVNTLPVYTFDEYAEKFGAAETIYYITSFPHGKAMKEQLLAAGVSSDDIFNFFEEITPFEYGQYFDFWEPRSKESFVDAGAFNGMSTQIFIDWCRGDYSNVWVFEPDGDNFRFCEELLGGKRQVKLYQAGLWSATSDRVKFCSGWQFGCRIAEEGNTEIATIALDDLLGGEAVSFIKMDVEGAECSALSGAEKIIRAQKPRLAISVYHNPEDMWKIPEMILGFDPSYRLAFRHYSLHTDETILYAE